MPETTKDMVRRYRQDLSSAEQPESRTGSIKRFVLSTAFVTASAVTAWAVWQTSAIQPALSNVSELPTFESLELDHGTAPLRPLPTTIALDQGKVALGRTLFNDARLSRDGSVACASCHNISMGGADVGAMSTGIGGAQSGVNSPTVLNSGLNFVQFWDGRAATLEEQVDGPVTHPGEMGSTWQEVIAKLGAVEGYVAAFERLYPDGLSVANVKDAIATFERSLITPNARFDRYLRGEAGAINEQEERGYELFVSFGCAACHQGRGVGGNMFQKLGIVDDYFRDRGHLTRADYGRYNVTNDEDDLHVFKVPSLRNVALTAPYFHDGSAETLDATVQIMAKYQLGLDLEEEDVAAIVAFLKTLTGDIPAESFSANTGGQQ